MVLRYFAVFLLFFAVLSCNNTTQRAETGEAEVPRDGLFLYENYCIKCHGSDGTLGNSGAKDLTQSRLEDNEIRKMIEEGKNAMPPVPQLMETAGDIDSVIGYVKSLRK